MKISLRPGPVLLRAGFLRIGNLRPLALATALWAIALLEPGRCLASPRIVAATADDVCAPDANPCVVDSVIVVRDGTILDFGTRTVSLTGKGQFRLQGDEIEIRCGDFLSTTAGRVALRSRKGETTKSAATIIARRTCSGEPLPCVRNEDCTLGTCSIGDGRIEINGNIRFAFVYDATIKLLASGDVLIGGDARSGGCLFSWLHVSSELGSVTSEGDVRLRGAAPYLTYDALGDVRVNGRSDVRGGEEDNGSFDAYSVEGDIVLSGDIDVSAAQGGGYGGDIFVSTEIGEIRIDGGTAASPQRIVANGSKGGLPGEGGAGGDIYVDAIGPMSIGQHVRIQADASSARGYGGYIALYASELTMSGKIEATGHYPGVELYADGNLNLASTSSISMRSASGYWGGDLYIRSRDANVRLDGQVSIEGGIASPDLHPAITMRGCDVVIANGSTTFATTELADFVVSARESLVVESGASMIGGTGGTQFRHRSGGPTPILDGLVTPSPLLVPDAALLPCSP